MREHNTLADLVLLLHFAVVLFNLGGLALVLAGYRRGWRLTRQRGWRVTHLMLVWFIAAQALLGHACPLTLLEDALRVTGPEHIASAEGGFLQRWISHVLYWDLPMWVFGLAYLLFAIAVTITFVKLPAR